MITPTYTAPVVVGGTQQTIVFKGLPDSMITRQSGDLTLIYEDQDGLPFDISSLTGSDFKCVPVDSGEIATTLATGVVGFSQEKFTITTGSTPPTAGTFAIRVAGETTAAIAYNANAATVLAALIALPSRSGGDFTVDISAKENLSFAGAQLLVETSGGFSISFDSTLDGALLTGEDTISMSITQQGSDIQNEYNANWNKDTIPASFATFDFDKSGAIAFYVAMEDGDDFYQPYQQINVRDDDFIGQGGAIPSNAIYVYNPNDPNKWLRIASSSPASISEGMDKIIAKNFSDFGMVLGQQTAPPGSPADNDAYIVLSPATGLWAGQEQQIATWSSTLVAWAFSNVHKDWDVVRDDSDSQLYRFNGSGPTWDIVTASIALPVDDTTELVRDPGDNTKTMRIDVGAVATGNSRVLTMPDNDIDLADIAAANSHIANMSNPHTVTAAQVGNSTAQWNADKLQGIDIVDLSGISNGQVLAFNGSSGDMEPVANGGAGGSGGIAFEMNFDTNDDGTEPASGGIKFDNTAIGSVTTIRVSITDVNAVNITNTLSTIGSGDAFWVRQLSDAAKFLYFAVTSSTFSTTSYNIVGTVISAGVLLDNAASSGIDSKILTVGGATGVSSFNGRTLGVVPAGGDYDNSQITNLSGVSGATTEDALNTLNNTLSPFAVAAGVDNVQAGVAYTLVLTDKDNTNIVMTSGSSHEITIPTNASVALPLAVKIPYLQRGVGVTTITGDTGVTVNGVSGGSVVVNNQFQGGVMWQITANDWVIPGDVT